LPGGGGGILTLRASAVGAVASAASAG
jgi:hypothetical protein